MIYSHPFKLLFHLLDFLLLDQPSESLLFFFNSSLLFFFDVFLGAHLEHTDQFAHLEHLVLYEVHIVALLKQERQLPKLAVYLPECFDFEEKLVAAFGNLLSLFVYLVMVTLVDLVLRVGRHKVFKLDCLQFVTYYLLEYLVDQLSTVKVEFASY